MQVSVVDVYKRQEYSRTLEFPGKERVELPIRVITLEDCSARKLEENGMILFLPFLFHCICELEEMCIRDRVCTVQGSGW